MLFIVIAACKALEADKSCIESILIISLSVTKVLHKLSLARNFQVILVKLMFARKATAAVMKYTKYFLTR